MHPPTDLNHDAVASPAAALPAMLIEDPDVLQNLQRIVSSIAYEASVRQDLMQEALVHLWRMQQERPGQRTSWYLQNCRFRLQHYLATGRSVDSLKRRSAQAVFSFCDGDNFPSPSLAIADDELETASAHDLMSSLEERLKPIECDVLHCLAEGLATIEIARKLRLSCPTVLKYRRKIARLTIVLENEPVTHLRPRTLRQIQLRCTVKVEVRGCRSATNGQLASRACGAVRLTPCSA